jgi:hypothetical protein
LAKAKEKYCNTKNKANLQKLKRKTPDDNESIELNFIENEDERIDTDDAFEEPDNTYSAHSETFLDKTTGNSSYERDKASSLQCYFFSTFQECSKLFETEYKSQNSKKIEDQKLSKALFECYAPSDHNMIDSVLSKIKRAFSKFDSAGLTINQIFYKRAK